MNIQLPLAVHWPQSAELSEFVAGRNAEALAALRRCVAGNSPSALLLEGPSGRGKSLLLQGAAREVQQRGARSAYLPLTLLGPEDAAALEGQDDLELVCVDELEHAGAHSEVAAALLRFIDHRRSSARALLIAWNPATPTPALPADLLTRIQACVRFVLHPLDDAELASMLRRRAAQRGLEMTEEVAAFLVRRCPRHPGELMAILDDLDRQSLSSQRRLTVPFVQQRLAARERASEQTAKGQ
jgi:DnaA family protein